MPSDLQGDTTYDQLEITDAGFADNLTSGLEPMTETELRNALALESELRRKAESVTRQLQQERLTSGESAVRSGGAQEVARLEVELEAHKKEVGGGGK